MDWFDGNQTANSIEKFETNGDEGNNSDEDDVDIDDSDSEDEESNDKLTLTILIPRTKKVMTSLMMLIFKLL